MSEDPLQRVVHLVRDSRDELPERRELFRLLQASTQRLAFCLELCLGRDVACHEHAADGLAIAVDQRRHRRGENASEAIVGELTALSAGAAFR